MPKNDGTMLRYNLDEPEDLKTAVLNGLIWVGGSNTQRGIDYVEKYDLKEADLKNLPDDVREMLFG